MPPSTQPDQDQDNEKDHDEKRHLSGDPRSAQKRNFVLQAARYSQLAFVLPAAVVVGWLAGAALDRWLHTTWLYLAGILLGITAGFVELIRTVSRDTK